MNCLVGLVGAKVLYWWLGKMASEDLGKSDLTDKQKKEMRVSLKKQKPAISNFRSEEGDYAAFFLTFAPEVKTSIAFLSIKSSVGFGATRTGG